MKKCIYALLSVFLFLTGCDKSNDTESRETESTGSGAFFYNDETLPLNKGYIQTQMDGFVMSGQEPTYRTTLKFSSKDKKSTIIITLPGSDITAGEYALGSFSHNYNGIDVVNAKIVIMDHGNPDLMDGATTMELEVVKNDEDSYDLIFNIPLPFWERHCKVEWKGKLNRN